MDDKEALRCALDIDPEKSEQLIEAVNQVWTAVKEMTEVFVAWWEQEIAPQLAVILESQNIDTSDYSSLAETLQKLSDLALGLDDYYRETPKRKHKTPYKPKAKYRLFDKRKRVHYCRNDC